MSLLRQLTRFELAWVRDTFVAIFPGPDGIGSMDIEGYVSSTLKRIGVEPVIGIRAAIWIVALAPLFVLRRLRTIHGLAPSDRELVFMALATSPIYAVRQLVLALKALAALLYAGDPDVRARLLAAPPAEPLVAPSSIVRRLPSSYPPPPISPVPSVTKEKKSHAALA